MKEGDRADLRRLFALRFALGNDIWLDLGESGRDILGGGVEGGAIVTD